MTSEDKKLYIYALIGVILMFSGWFIPPIAPITEVGMQLTGVFIGLVWLWSTCGMLWPSILGIAAMIMSDYGTMSSILAASMGTYNVWVTLLMMGIFGVIEYHGVNNYIVRWVLTRKVINGRPWTFTFVYLFTVFALSVFSSPFAIIFMFLPLTYKLAEDVGYQKDSMYIRLLTIGVVISAAASAAILPFKGWILQIGGIWQGMSGEFPFTYGQHLGVILPISVLYLIGYVLVMRFVFRVDVSLLKNISIDYFNATPLPPMNWLQKFLLCSILGIVMILFLPTILPATWGITKVLNKLGVGGITLVIFAILCCIRYDGKSIVDFKYICSEKISWDLGFLLGCVMAISSALTADVTGVKPFLSALLNPIFGGLSPIFIFLVMMLVCLVLTNLANNGVIAFLLLSIVYITIVPMQDVTNVGFFVTMLAFISQVAFLIPGSSLYGALLHGNELLQAGLIYKVTICLCVVSAVLFLIVGWPLSLLLY